MRGLETWSSILYSRTGRSNGKSMQGQFITLTNGQTQSNHPPSLTYVPYSTEKSEAARTIIIIIGRSLSIEAQMENGRSDGRFSLIIEYYLVESDTHIK